ncbi:hypothetical protein CN273_07225 [Bacillus thuringiensis]|uniref:Transposase IS204/IS1001/IS1096/IS1165 zinc-finger domain-containing protein n=1 Tax=Bacillus thuringiensis TaxID=1428 RepID=A0AB36TP03_BACTU|nr:hypothetical protein COM74_13100 [Bacillus thuringiensis]PEE88889.1 hypothetical protein COM90_10370 [Bacillus thuringiensis]PFB87238.1 hypothetical protein CN273_07225 [Bacillus thuringiensis]PFM86210.1 hypothetical protein COJ61_25875 [Bacillus thuringiensis]
MISVSIDLSNFKILKHEGCPNLYFVTVEKKILRQRCACCGFFSSSVHDRKTSKVKDLDILHKTGSPPI